MDERTRRMAENEILFRQVAKMLPPFGVSLIG